MSTARPARRAAGSEANGRLGIYEDLMTLTVALAGERQIETLMAHVIEAARRISGADGAAIFTLDRLARFLHPVSWSYGGAKEGAGPNCRIAIYGPSLSPNLSDPAAFAVATGTIVNLADVATAAGYDLSNLRAMDRSLGFATRSVVIIPLIAGQNQTFGILQLANPRGPDGAAGKLHDELIRPVRGLAAHAAIALWNARLFEANQRLIRQLGRQNEELSAENSRLAARGAARKPVKPAGLIGDSPPLEHVLGLIGRAAASDLPILLRGETGTGKEMLAGFIHASSNRDGKPFVIQNCAALPEALLESELFGHVKGAFTGATVTKPGLVHEAHGGTLFLDEIGDMPLNLQPKVLRLLQEGEVRRVGATRPEYVDVRIVAATNADLEEKMTAGEFRRDLFYRLNVFPVTAPPLRERLSDIPRLIDHFVAAASQRAGRKVPEISPGALDALMCWSYPGNIRELKNIIERAVLLADEDGPIGQRHLPAELGRMNAPPAAPTAIPGGSLKAIVAEYETRVLEAKLREANWNRSRLARDLKVSRRTIVEKLSRYKIDRPGNAEPD